MKTRVAMILALATVCGSARADSDWPLKFSETSSKDLIALHEKLLAPSLDGVRGVAVQDAVWQADAFEIRIKSGTVFVEPPVEGAPVGAFFVGDATATFKPIADEQRRHLTFWFTHPSLDAEPITSGYFFTLRGADLLAQLGASGTPSVPLSDATAYAEAKHALRQRGLSTLEAFLNRDGRSKGAAFAILAAPSIRLDRSKSAFLMMRFDPSKQEETGIEVYGHANMVDQVPWKFLFRTVVSQQAAKPQFVAPAADVSYTIDLTLGMGMDSAEQTVKASFKPAPGMRALRLGLTPFLQVESVRLGSSRDLPFVQWKREGSGNNLDETLLVDLGGTGAAAGPVEVVVKSSGGLFEPFGDAFYLIDEDAWYPGIRDAQLANYELRVSLPNERIAVAPGRLVDDRTDSDKRHYVFKTTHPQKASSVYIGRFQHKTGEADGTKIEVYVGKDEKNLNFAVVELQNMVKVYNRLFKPLDLETLRVAAAPVDHGRGFDGLLLLSAEVGFYGGASESDVFRAHEVAHQWWGNVVAPERWPRDRWLSESFAEYSAMEYFRARYEDQKKTRDAIGQKWMFPLQRSQKSGTRDLRGNDRSGSWEEMWSILDGDENVYTKGPMVLQMFRYMLSVKTGGDDQFWEVLRTFLKEYSGKTASTEDFINVSQRVTGVDLHWFWSQWLLRSEIPKVRFSRKLEPKDGKLLLTVDIEQVDTDFTLLIPVYVHFSGDRIATKPLLVKGHAAKLQMFVPEEPRDITINDSWDALIDVVP